MDTGSPIMSEGRKYDGGKAPMGQGLLAYFPGSLWEVAQISRYGKEKYETTYAERNWTKVEDGADRYLDAALRHITAHLKGQTYDMESGHPHLSHAAWNIHAARELTIAAEKAQILDPTFERDTGVTDADLREANEIWEEIRRESGADGLFSAR